MQNAATGRIAYRYSDLAAELGVHRDTVRRWAREGRIRTVTIGGTVLIPATEVERILAGQAEGGAA